MKLKHILQGRGLAHPLHPALVHIPIGLWVGAVVFDVLSLTASPMQSYYFVVGSYYLILAGVIAAVPAVLTGLAEREDVPRGTTRRSLTNLHLSLNVVLLLGYLLQLLTRNLRLDRVQTGVFIFNLVELCGLLISGYIGGKLVFEKRVGSRATERVERAHQRKAA